MADLDDQLREAFADSTGSGEEGKEEASRHDVGDSAPSTPVSQNDVDAAAVLGAAVLDTPGLVADGQRAEREPSRNLGLLVALLVACGGILALVFTSVDDAAIYSVTTDQLVQNRDKYEDRNVRVEGDLVSGSLSFRKEPCEYRFKIEKKGEELAIRYPECVVPDTLKDTPGVEVQVTAEGLLNASGHFDATHIMAKCPSKYEMKKRAENGEVAPHAVMGAAPSSAGPSETDSPPSIGLDEVSPSQTP